MRAGSAIASSTRHILGVAVQALLVTAIVVALVIAAATAAGSAPGGANSVFAAKGGNGHGHGPGGGGGGSDASVTVPDGVFGGTTTATANPGGDFWLKARCFQNGTLVYYQSEHVDLNNQVVFTLGPTPLWIGGAADCTAEAGYYATNWAWRSLATTTFSVSG